jgi:hypothetical protein
MGNPKAGRALSLLLLACIGTACTAPSVDVESGRPPRFSVHPRGNEPSFTVRRIEFRDSASNVLWRIVPSAKHPEKALLFEYGVLPRGYAQAIPALGVSPAPLTSVRASALIVYAETFEAPLCLKTTDGRIEYDDSMASSDLPYSQP